MRLLAQRFGWFALVVGLALAFAATMTIWGGNEAAPGAQSGGETTLYARGAGVNKLTTSLPWMISFAVLVAVFIALTAAGIRDTIHSMLEQDAPVNAEEPVSGSDPQLHHAPEQLR